MPCDKTDDVLKQYIQPKWPAPTNIHAFTTTRQAQYQRQDGYDMFNLALHVGEEKETVLKNRQKLCEELSLPEMPIWLKQTHSEKAIALDQNSPTEQSADASYTKTTNKVCAILTADCLPILVCNKSGSEVAAIHAGWRGLFNGIIENTLAGLKSDTTDLLVWLGPAISAARYQVGNELRNKFMTLNKDYQKAFVQHKQSWNLDLYTLAKLQLKQLGVEKIYGANYCTYVQNGLFYSHRREGPKTGRIASLIWIA